MCAIPKGRLRASTSCRCHGPVTVTQGWPCGSATPAQMLHEWPPRGVRGRDSRAPALRKGLQGLGHSPPQRGRSVWAPRAHGPQAQGRWPPCTLRAEWTQPWPGPRLGFRAGPPLELLSEAPPSAGLEAAGAPAQPPLGASCEHGHRPVSSLVTGGYTRSFLTKLV